MDICSNRTCYRPYFGQNCLEKNFLTTFNSSIIGQFYEEGCTCEQLIEDNTVKNWNCEYQFYDHSWYVQLFYIFIFGLVVLTSIGGNAIVVWVVLAHKRMRNVTNYFLVNLAIADASISLLNVCFSFTTNFYYEWLFSDFYCAFNHFMGVMPTCASVFTLMSLSLDRYWAVVYPLRKRLSPVKTVSIIVIIWLLACLCGLPLLLYANTVKVFMGPDGRSLSTVCRSDGFPDGDSETSVIFSVYNKFLLFVTYLSPLIVLSFTYIKMGLELWGSSHIGDHRQEAQIKAKRKIIKMMITVVAIFMLCWLPYHLYWSLLVDIFAKMDIYVALFVYLNIYLLAMSSTVVNPIIYIWMNRKFREAFKYVFRFLPCVHYTRAQYLSSELRRDMNGCGHTPRSILNQRDIFRNDASGSSGSMTERTRCQNGADGRSFSRAPSTVSRCRSTLVSNDTLDSGPLNSATGSQRPLLTVAERHPPKTRLSLQNESKRRCPERNKMSLSVKASGDGRSKYLTVTNLKSSGSMKKSGAKISFDDSRLKNEKKYVFY